jgi:hypothetical protein
LGGFDEQGDFKVNPDQIKAIAYKFHELAVHRQDYVMNRRAVSRIKPPEQPEVVVGRPSLNEKSRKLATGKVPTQKNYADYLMQRGKDYKQKRAEAAQTKEKSLAETEGLTFTPAILDRESKNKTTAVQVDKFEQLYQEGK